MHANNTPKTAGHVRRASSEFKFRGGDFISHSHFGEGRVLLCGSQVQAFGGTFVRHSHVYVVEFAHGVRTVLAQDAKASFANRLAD